MLGVILQEKKDARICILYTWRSKDKENKLLTVTLQLMQKLAMNLMVAFTKS